MRQNLKGRLSVDNKGVFRTESNIYDAAFFAKIVNSWKPFTIFAKKSFNEDVRLGSKYVYHP